MLKLIRTFTQEVNEIYSKISDYNGNESVSNNEVYGYILAGGNIESEYNITITFFDGFEKTYVLSNDKLIDITDDKEIELKKGQYKYLKDLFNIID